MAKGTSGRVVIEIDPELKDRLYAALDKDGLTLKSWFLECIESYLNEGQQLSLQFDDGLPFKRAS